MSNSVKSRVLLVGSGGVGTIAAYALETGGHAEVTAVCRSNFKVASESGFRIDSIDHGQAITGFRPSHLLGSVPNVAEENIDAFDFIVVTTKNVPDISPTVLDVVSPAITPSKTAIVLLQNGINIEKPFIQHYPGNVILSGISLIGATETSHGVVRHDDRDRSKIGPFPGQDIPGEISVRKAREFIEMYNACGKVDCRYDEDVAASRWRKLVYNASFNSVSAILGMDTARMRMSRIVIDDLVRPAMLEIMATAKASGVMLPPDLDSRTICVDPTDTAFVPSMGQDAAKGNFLEMENIVGEPVRIAKTLGVATPTLRTLYGLLRGIQLKTKEAKGLWEPRFEVGNPYS